jgi:ubiquinone/menaquinone biosynthesis C-methylase UbiE
LQPLASAVMATDEPYIYRVEGGILVALPGLAMVMDGSPSRQTSADKRLVQDFYNQLGWTRGGTDKFVDAEKWEDMRAVSAEYVRKCHRRVKRHLPARGEYLLDAASGPVQYDAYLEYSEDYRARICIDLSFRALQEAKDKLGDRGIYILGDVTNLPLQDNAVDAAVSLHTIYHVPADEQAQAFCEIYRVLKPDGSAAVVYAWHSALAKLALLPARLIQAPLRIVRKLVSRKQQKDASPNGSDLGPAGSNLKLYFHAYPFSWFARRSWPMEHAIYTWRSVSVAHLRAYAHRLMFGRALLNLLYKLEERFPRFFGKWGAYPLIVIYKR